MEDDYDDELEGIDFIEIDLDDMACDIQELTGFKLTDILAILSAERLITDELLIDMGYLDDYDEEDYEEFTYDDYYNSEYNC